MKPQDNQLSPREQPASPAVGYLEFDFLDEEDIESHSYLLSAVRSVSSSLPSPARVLDLGCGNGDLLAALHQPHWHSQGVDMSSSGIVDARRKYPGIEFHQRPFDHSLVADLGPSSFDLVISTEVIEHLYAPREMCRVAFDLLKPDGLFVLSTPYHGYLKNCALAFTGKLDKHFTALKDCGHIKFWSYRTLTILLREAGFSGFRFKGAGRLPWLWKSMVVTARKPS